jgi:para-aminobenzoate synthetase component 1
VLEPLAKVIYNKTMNALKSYPFVLPLPSELSPLAVFQRLKSQPYCCWLDSALIHEKRGSFSFLCADPVDTLEIQRAVADPLAKLERWMQSFQSLTVPDLPPFQGGVAGYFGYEFGRCYERVPLAKHDEFALPVAVLGLYDVVFAWDHSSGKGWILSQGFPESDSVTRRMERAQSRARKFLQIATGALEPGSSSTSVYTSRVSVHATAHGLTAPQFETRLGGGWLGNFDSDGYRKAVARAREYIHAGDIFQVNLSQRLLCPARCDSSELYEKLRTVNSAPFAAYFDFGQGQIVSASPERLLQVKQRWVETRPIKGTRKRTGNESLDRQVAHELHRSEKDRSENIMIVDLLRNDLSRVCDSESLLVTQLCQLEEYPYVMHLVSALQARLRDDVTVSDLFAAVFPGGSITGAPKVRAMEIIAELEPTVRGPYCGSIGYCSADGAMDWNILIRTLTSSRGWWQFQVGGGIVADSVPSQEEEETWTKAAGLIAAIDSVTSHNSR